jgi:superfamily II DNA/RNA helicase
MERALDLNRLTEALGERPADSPRRLPTPEELQELLADAEMRVFLRQTEIPDDLIRAGWYLHGVASANAALELYSYARRRRAFEISAHIFDLALNEEARSRRERLSLAFGAQIGYRRAELDPNATAIFTRVEPLLIREPPVEAHVDSLALEAGVALLGFQTSTLFDLYRSWLRQLGAVHRLTGVNDLWGTMFGPAHRVVTGCMALINFLAFGRDDELGRARAAFEQLVMDEVAAGDLDARWVAAHLLDFTGDAEVSSVWRLLPPDIPTVARQAFTLASPPVLTLWPPQRLLFAPGEGPDPLSAETRRVVLSIPTSSGKTLLAQLMIVAHLARGNAGGVCFVAPMRSLGREVRRALRNRLRVLARELGAELPDFGPLLELLSGLRGAEPAAAQAPETEVSLMQLLAGMTSAGGPADVEVMTPERLAHLLRRDPETVLQRFQMFVFDEAHFLAERGRGFTLESILAFLHWRTLHTDHRIVLLSAALGNEGQIMSWLDPAGVGVPIRSDWRGPRRLHAIFTTRPDWEQGVESRVQSRDWPLRISYPLSGVIRLRPAEGAAPRTLSLREPVGTLALRYSEDRVLRRTPSAGPKDGPPYSTQLYKMTARMVAALGAFGAVLVVTSTRRIAQDMARELASLFPDDPRAIPLADMATQRLGAAHPLSPVLRKGIAFHHAALPVDVLEELEEALRDGTLRFMTCTSTLTEGVNLPVRTVVLAETQWDEAESLLSGVRLVNAMGRAGRAGKESEGWIVLVRAAEERPSDFALMSPAREELEIRSRLATDEALETLAEFEEAVRRGEDATFAFAADAIGEFLSFVWFILSSEEARGIAPDEADLDGALGATLVFAQTDEPTRVRWRSVAETARSSYIAADPQRRRHWAHSGTSVATARRLDDLADAVVGRVLARVDTEGKSLAETLADPVGALTLLAEVATLTTLLSLPENDRPWRFRQTRAGQSLEISVDPEALLREWVRGESIPDLAETFLSEVSEQDWRVEQVVDAVAQHFEHFLAWTLGVVIELVNERLAEASIAAPLCEPLPSYVRYGVDSPLALRLVVSGVRSRRLAHVIAAAAAAEQVEGDSLRQWLGSMEIADLRRRFSASSSELLDLLEFARTPRASVLRDLLEQGRSVIEVHLVKRTAEAEITTSAEEDHAVPEAATTGEDEGEIPVDLRQVVGEERPPRLGVFSAETYELIALVPTPSYGDVESILDTGVPTTGTLRGETLELVLASETAA